MSKIKKIITLENICAFIFVFITFITIYAPYSASSTLGNDSLRRYLRILLYILTFVCVIFVLCLILKRKRIEDFNALSLLPILIAFFLSKIHIYSSDSFSNIYLIIWFAFCFSPNEIKLKSFIIFKKILTFFCFLGIVCFMLYFLKVTIGYSVVQYYFKSGMKYIDYHIVWLISNGSTIRLCCIYNEPGFLGTVVALILCASNMNLRNKENVILFIAGVLCFSLAFVLIVLLYFILKNLKKIKTVSVVLLISLIYIFVLPNINTGNYQIDRFIQRFSITEKGIAGDNRSGVDLDSMLDYTMKENPFFGMGAGFSKSQVSGLSVKSYIVDYGIIGCILLYGSLLLSVIKCCFKKSEIWLFVFVFCLSIYQRPDVMNIQFQLVLYGGILYLIDCLSKTVSVVNVKEVKEVKEL